MRNYQLAGSIDMLRMLNNLVDKNSIQSVQIITMKYARIFVGISFYRQITSYMKTVGHNKVVL